MRVARFIILGIVAAILLSTRALVAEKNLKSSDLYEIRPYKLPSLANVTFQPYTSTKSQLSNPIWTSYRPPSIAEISKEVKGFSGKVAIYSPNSNVLGIVEIYVF